MATLKVSRPSLTHVIFLTYASRQCTIFATTIASLRHLTLYIRLGALLYTLLYFNPLDHDLLRGVAEEVKYHVVLVEMEIGERLDKKFEYYIQLI